MAVGSEGLTKKERLGMEREQSKLQASLGGITQMGGVPDLLFVIDVKKEALAVAEANKLGIPVIAVVDTNCSPSGVDYIIPGNDDAARAISLYCDLIARSALDGMTEQMGAAGVDLGEMEDAPIEAELNTDNVAEEAAKAEPVAEEAAKAEPVAEEAAKAKPVAEEAAKAEPVAEQAVKAEPVKVKAATKKKAETKTKVSSSEEEKVKPKAKSTAKSKKSKAASEEASPEVVNDEKAAKKTKKAKADKTEK